MKVKEESEKVGLKLNIQKTKIMASGPITSWEIDGETVETVSVNYSGGPNIVTCEQCMLSSCLTPQYNVCSFVVLRRPPYLMILVTVTSHWYDNYGLAVLHEKQRHYFANKGPSSQGYGFSTDHVWM